MLIPSTLRSAAVSSSDGALIAGLFADIRRSTLHCVPDATVPGTQKVTSQGPLPSILACCTRGFFPHQGEEAAYLTAIALNNRRKFGALCDCHTDTFNDNVADFEGAVIAHQPPIDP